MESEPPYDIIINSPSPEEIASSKIPDNLVKHVTSLLVDRAHHLYHAIYVPDGRSFGKYRIGEDDLGFTVTHVPKHPQTIGAACIDIADDNAATRHERTGFYREMFQYIANHVGGIYLPKAQKVRLSRMSQQDIARLLRFDDCPLLQSATFMSVWYTSVPESIAFETGFPSEKVKLHRPRE